MILTTSILIGFARLALLAWFLFFLNKKILNYHYPKDILNYVVNRWVRYGSLLVILIFLLTQINAYDLFTVILFLILFLLIHFFDIKGLNSFFTDIKYKLKFLLVFIIKNRETKGKVFKLNKTIKSREDRKGRSNLIVLAIISVAIIVSRLSFFSKDIYLFSDLWEINLVKVKGITANIWFPEDMTMTGEYALINFYNKLVGVSPEIALQSFGILETILIAIILFWFTAKITKSRTVAPIVTTLFFVFSPILLPRSVGILTQHKHIFLALSLALPMMVFTVLPKNLSELYKKHFLYSIIIFTAIALIDLFTSLVLLSPFLVLAFFFSRKKYMRNYFLTVLAYIISLVFVLGIYGLVGVYYNINFKSIITSNLLSLSVFTHLPDLVMPYEDLIKIYQYISLFNLVFMLLLVKQRRHWLNSFLFILYFNVLIFINSLNLIWVDEDLIRLSLTVFIPIILGISFALLSKIILKITNQPFKNNKIKYRYRVLVIFGLSTILFYSFKPIVYDGQSKQNSNKHSKIILEAYEKISQSYLPYSYTVVNDYRSLVLSQGKHFFMPYSTFNDIYLHKDSVYHNNIEDKMFFRQNPEKILTKSILIFLHKIDDGKKSHLPFYADKEMNTVENNINILKSRGRIVNIIYEKESLCVIEIINKPNSSKINDLLF